MKKAILGLGSNMGDRLAYLHQAMEQINQFPQTTLLRCSSIYETEPWGNLNQGNFLNCCCEIYTDLTPLKLLEACLALENQLGRVRNEVWGERTIDIDLLIVEGETSDEITLTLPHSRIRQRGFVLVPLQELYPNGNALGYEFSESLQTIGTDGITLFAKH